MYLIPKALFIATVLGARTNHHNNPVESGKMLASFTPTNNEAGALI